MTVRLVLCLDGTWNSTFTPVEREDGTKVLKPTNPLKIARAVRPVDDSGNRQITYYDSGVGALGLYPGISNRLLSFFDSKLGGVWGAGFEANVEQAANFIANNYTEGAEIFIFGFSRGAAQARALTNFLGWLGGITPKDDAYYVPLLFKKYLETKGTGDPRSVQSGKGYVPADHVLKLRVKLLGVFDTVMALGSRLRASTNNSTHERSFHVRAKPSPCVEHARQAIAIDEQRYDFRPEIWRGKHDETLSLEQRWFAGVHANVGGSYGDDGLANCALHWIAGEARNQGLAFDNEFLRKYRPFPQDTLVVNYNSFYRFIDSVRFRSGRGKRVLTLKAGDADLSIDPSAIARFHSDYNEFEKMKEEYRPAGLRELID